MHISDFQFFRNQKVKKEKWQCCHNLDLNPTYGYVDHCNYPPSTVSQ